MAVNSNILAWEVSQTEKPGGLESMGLQRVVHDWAAKPPPYTNIRLSKREIKKMILFIIAAKLVKY